MFKSKHNKNIIKPKYDSRILTKNLKKKNNKRKKRKEKEKKKKFIGSHMRPSIAHIRHRKNKDQSLIKIVKNKKLKKLKNHDICGICLDNIRNNKFTTSCNHKFHEDCIKQWYNKKKTCPNCRNPLQSKLLEKKNIHINPLEETLRNEWRSFDEIINERIIQIRNEREIERLNEEFYYGIHQIYERRNIIRERDYPMIYSRIE